MNSRYNFVLRKDKEKNDMNIIGHVYTDFQEKYMTFWYLQTEKTGKQFTVFKRDTHIWWITVLCISKM